MTTIFSMSLQNFTGDTEEIHDKSQNSPSLDQDLKPESPENEACES
jgi:hypothetical protein